MLEYGMKKRYAWTPVLCMALAFTACGSTHKTEAPAMPDIQNEFPPEPMTEADARSYFQEQGLTVGWNMGNTLDAHRDGVSSETIWGNPQANQTLFNGVKAAGFTLVRIPITWMGHIGPAPDYRLEEALLKRAAETVGYARQAGLTAIINLHHDGATEKKDNTVLDRGWLSINTARTSEEGMKQVTAQFERVWTQIARYFKNYGDYLIFESMNEVHDGNWGWGTESAQRPQYEIVNRWNQVFVNAVRETGGNNARRFLAIPGYCTVPRHTLADYFKLPEDGANGVSKFIVTFHYYDPYEFAILGTRHEWGSDADRAKTDNDFRPFKARFIDRGVPVIVGESGAVRQPGFEPARLDYLAWVYAKAREYGLVPLYWDNGAYTGPGENFGLFNRATGEPNSPESRTVIETMIEAAGR